MILNTAFSSYRDNYLTWAADAYVTKSSDVTELLDTVQRSAGRADGLAQLTVRDAATGGRRVAPRHDGVRFVSEQQT